MAVWRLLDQWRVWSKDKGTKGGYPTASAFARSVGDRIHTVEDFDTVLNKHSCRVIDRIMDDLFEFEPRLSMALRREVLGECWEYRGEPEEIVPRASDEFKRRAIKAGILWV